MYVSVVAKCLSIITSFNPTSKGFLELVTDVMVYALLNEVKKSTSRDVFCPVEEDETKSNFSHAFFWIFVPDSQLLQPSLMS